MYVAAQGDCCYVTMLICDIAKMQNVLDFPVQLAIVQRELSLGQRYLASPVGLLDPKEISVEVLQSAFQAATPSLVSTAHCRCMYVWYGTVCIGMSPISRRSWAPRRTTCS